MKHELNEYVVAAVRARLSWIEGQEASAHATLGVLEGRLGDTKAKLRVLEVEKLELAHFLVEAGKGSAVEITAEGWKVYK